MWEVTLYNYYHEIATETLTTEEIMQCLQYDHDYYVSIDPVTGDVRC